jgi:hypothetical protein
MSINYSNIFEIILKDFVIFQIRILLIDFLFYLIKPFVFICDCARHRECS